MPLRLDPGFAAFATTSGAGGAFAMRYLEQFGFKGRLGRYEQGTTGFVHVKARQGRAGLAFGGRSEFVAANAEVERTFAGVDREVGAAAGAEEGKGAGEHGAAWRRAAPEAGDEPEGEGGSGPRRRGGAGRRAAERAGRTLRTAAEVAAGAEPGGGAEGEMVIVDMTGGAARLLAASALDSAAVEGASRAGERGAGALRALRELRHNLRTLRDMAEAEVREQGGRLGALQQAAQAAQARVEAAAASLAGAERQAERRRSAAQRLADAVRVCAAPAAESQEAAVKALERLAGAVRAASDLSPRLVLRCARTGVAGACAAFRSAGWDPLSVARDGPADASSLGGLAGALRAVLEAVSGARWSPEQHCPHSLAAEGAAIALAEHGGSTTALELAPEPVSPVPALGLAEGSRAAGAAEAVAEAAGAQLLPAVAAAMRERWEPQTQCPQALRLFGALCRCCARQQVESLATALLQPLLVASLSAADASAPPHRWALPWVHFSARAARGCGAALLQAADARMASWRPADASPARLLAPWAPVLPPADLASLVQARVAPRLASLAAQAAATASSAEDAGRAWGGLAAALGPWRLPRHSPLLPAEAETRLVAAAASPVWLRHLRQWLAAAPRGQATGRATMLLAWLAAALPVLGGPVQPGAALAGAALHPLARAAIAGALGAIRCALRGEGQRPHRSESALLDCERACGLRSKLAAARAAEQLSHRAGPALPRRGRAGGRALEKPTGTRDAIARAAASAQARARRAATGAAAVGMAGTAAPPMTEFDLVDSVSSRSALEAIGAEAGVGLRAAVAGERVDAGGRLHGRLGPLRVAWTQTCLYLLQEGGQWRPVTPERLQQSLAEAVL